MNIRNRCAICGRGDDDCVGHRVCFFVLYKRHDSYDDDDPSCSLRRLGARITACSLHTKSVKLSLFTRPPTNAATGPPARARRPALANHQCLPLLLDHRGSEVFHEPGQFLSQLLLLRSDAGAPTVLAPASVAFTQRLRMPYFGVSNRHVLRTARRPGSPS